MRFITPMVLTNCSPTCKNRQIQKPPRGHSLFRGRRPTPPPSCTPVGVIPWNLACQCEIQGCYSCFAALRCRRKLPCLRAPHRQVGRPLPRSLYLCFLCFLCLLWPISLLISHKSHKSHKMAVCCSKHSRITSVWFIHMDVEDAQDWRPLTPSSAVFW